MCARFLKKGKFSLVFVGSMDKTLVFFDMVPNKPFAKKDSKSAVAVRTSGCEKKHVLFVLTIAAWWDTLPPMIKFPCKFDRTIKDLTVPITSVLSPRKKFEWMNVRWWYSMKKITEIRAQKKKGFSQALNGNGCVLSLFYRRHSSNSVNWSHRFCKSPCRLYI